MYPLDSKLWQQPRRLVWESTSGHLLLWQRPMLREHSTTTLIPWIHQTEHSFHKAAIPASIFADEHRWGVLFLLLRVFLGFPSCQKKKKLWLCNMHPTTLPKHACRSLIHNISHRSTKFWDMLTLGLLECAPFHNSREKVNFWRAITTVYIFWAFPSWDCIW